MFNDNRHSTEQQADAAYLAQRIEQQRAVSDCQLP